MVFAFLPGSVWRNVLVARTLRSTTRICGRPASSSGESTRVTGWGIDIRGSSSMSSHRDLFASLGGRFGKAISLALAGLIVMSGQNLAYAGTDTSTPTTDATATASAPSGEDIVTFASVTTDAQRQDALVAVDAVSASSVPALRMYSASLTDAAVTTLRANPDVTRVEADAVREAQATPSDPSYGSQWALPKIDWDAAFGTVTPAGSATVAVLDTGIDATADLTGNLVAGASMLDGVTGTGDPNGHGTAMASIVAAGTDNGAGIAGVGYQGVSVMPVKVLGADGTGQDSDIVRGVVYAADHGADVILMSFSNPGRSAALQSAADYAWSKGAVLVAATGNDGSTTATYPAGLAKVVGVSATTRDDSLWTGSNSGADTFLGAPGVDIASGSGAVTGTSASAAVVAGAAALVKANDASTSNGVVVGRLARTADAAGSVSDTGNGRVNLARALSDSSTDSVVPQGVGGNGGPIVGPYVVAAATVNSATLNGGSSVTVATGGSITAAVTATSGNGNGNRVGSIGWRIAPTAPGSVTCVNVADHNNTTRTDSFSITAPTASGTYNAYFVVYTDDACLSSASTPLTLSNSVTVTGNREPSATVVLSPVSPTTNQTVTATATKADADGDAGALTYVWKVNGRVVKTTAGSRPLPYTRDLSVAGNGNRGDIVRVEVTPNDGIANGLTVADSVTAANAAPVAMDDSFSTSEDTGLVVITSASVLVNDTDADGNALTAVKVSGPAHGSVTLNADGGLSYTPAANYNGP